MKPDRDQEPIMTATASSHIKPTQLVAGTFVTTDIKRARRMCQSVVTSRTL